MKRLIAFVLLLSLPVAASASTGTIVTRKSGTATFTRWDDGYRYVQISINGNTAAVRLFHRSTGTSQTVELPVSELRAFLAAVDTMLGADNASRTARPVTSSTHRHPH